MEISKLFNLFFSSLFFLIILSLCDTFTIITICYSPWIATFAFLSHRMYIFILYIIYIYNSKKFVFSSFLFLLKLFFFITKFSNLSNVNVTYSSSCGLFILSIEFLSFCFFNNLLNGFLLFNYRKFLLFFYNNNNNHYYLLICLLLRWIFCKFL